MNLKENTLKDQLRESKHITGLYNFTEPLIDTSIMW